MLPEKPKRVCRHSNVEFVPKRTNQVFISKECRIAHHNEMNNIIRKKLSIINNQLIKNYKILNEIVWQKSKQHLQI
jgi:Zn-finger protein